MTETRILRVPAKFWDEQHEPITMDERRDQLPPVVRRTARSVWIECTAVQAAELRSDASYYWSQRDGSDPDTYPLCASGRSTMRAIDRQWPDLDWTIGGTIIGDWESYDPWAGKRRPY